MKRVDLSVTVRELIEGYDNNSNPHEDVVAWGGKLNVRPAYQREFVYKEAQQQAVIDTLLNDCPIGLMCWSSNGDGTYGLLDGQQRTLSICEFAVGNFYVKVDGVDMKIHNLKRNRPELYERFMNTKLLVYSCEGTHEETLQWFHKINTVGEKMEEQEIRNINYTGRWLTSAKKYFSKQNCPAAQIAMAKGTKYINKSCEKQLAFELVLKWITNTTDKDMTKVCQYMADHQDDANADELWNYFESVINWVKRTFTNYRKEMCRDDWGFLYNEYHDMELDPDELEEQIRELYKDEEITSQKGIYVYIFDGDERHLSIRKFNDNQKNRMYERQNGICPICGEYFKLSQMEADHIQPWSKGGKTIESNGQMLCKRCNKDKSSGN